MKIINLRMHQVKRLKELELDKSIFNTEGLMLILNKKFKCDGKRMLFKYLDAQDDEAIMARKNFIVSMLNSEENYKNIDQLIIPEYGVAVDSKLCGFAMPLIEKNTNLGYLLNNEKIELDEKTYYLHELGNLIDKVHRTNGKSIKMYFGDLNEYNFIIDENNNLLAIDLDSAYVGQDMPVNMSYYLLKNNYIKKIPMKYQVRSNGYVDVAIPNMNTDLYCYNMICLNTIANESMHNIDMNNYFKYLEYLNNLGVNKDLLDSFNDIYLPVDNTNPKDFINETSYYGKTHKLTYKAYTRKYNI